MSRRVGILLLAAAALATASPARGHEARPGYLELRETSPGHYATLWKQPARGELVLHLEPRFPDGCALQGAASEELQPGALVTRTTLVCEGGLAGGTIRIAGLEATLTDVLLRVRHASGAEETHLLRPAQTSATVAGSARGAERVLAYLRLGVQHILLGVDHLLFVLGLLLLVRGPWLLLKTITAFTLAHSLTLAIATLGYAQAPGPPLAAAIALSILFLGPEIVRFQHGGTSLTIRHPWVVAFAFGLLHGFGFASGLTSMGLPQGEIPLALLLFNLGVEAGQIAFLAVVLLLERAFRVLAVRWPRPLPLLPAYAIGSLGAYWTLQRMAVLFGIGR